MENKERLGKASRALFVVSVVLGVVMLILAALAIVLGAFKSKPNAEQSLALTGSDDRSRRDRPSGSAARPRLIEQTGSSQSLKRAKGKE
ncbi:hypothetical protein [Cohnella sp. GCM10027633]|uniref:hypothetical protein n=1 Tax=unclassified Cohnella TaxID=2636738 RepID=UPI00362583AA